MSEAVEKPTVFISYSHKDEKWKDRLVAQLGVSQQQGHLVLWDDRRIGAGEDWYQAIMSAIDAGSVAVILISKNSLTSDFILWEEVPRLLLRRDEERLRIFPIVVEPCDWEAVEWVRSMQLRPKDGKPLSGGNKHQVETKLVAIAKEIRTLLQPADTATDSPTHFTSAAPKISIYPPIAVRDLFGRDEAVASSLSGRSLRVFLCHSSGDKPAVRKLYHRLRAENIEPWLDEENLLPGQDWNYEISKAVRTSDVVIVCLSNASINKAGYIQKEIKGALDIADEQPEDTIFLIPLKLEECDVPARLQRWHWVNFFEESGYDRLIRALKLRASKLGINTSPNR